MSRRGSVLRVTAALLALAAAPGSGQDSEQATAEHPSIRSALAQLDAAGPGERADRLGALALVYHALGFETEAAERYAQALELAPDEPRWRYYRAVLRDGAGDTEGARADLLGVRDAWPGNRSVHERLGDLALRHGAQGSAQSHYEAALRLAPASDPARAKALAGLAEVARRRGALDEAVSLWSEALALQPDATSLQYPLGLALRDLGRMDEARTALAAAGSAPVVSPDPLLAALVPETAGFFLAQAAQRAAAGDLEGALEEVTRALDAEPASVPALRARAETLWALGRVTDAVSSYRDVAVRAPEEARSHVDLARALLALPETAGLDEADTALGRALALDAEHPEALELSARARMARGDGLGAKALLERVLEIHPEQHGARWALAELVAAEGNSAEAARLLQQLLDAGHERVRVLVDLATLLGRESPSRAREALEKAVREGGASPGDRALAHFARGNLEFAQGRLADAVDAYRRSAELEPQARDTQFNLGAALLRMGDAAAAAEAFEAGVSAAPDDAELLLAAARALALAGRTRAAVDAFERGAARAPGHLGLRAGLARLLVAAPEEELRDVRRGFELARAAFDERVTTTTAETFAFALAAVGQFESAATLQRQLAEQAQRKGDAETHATLEDNLARYQRGETGRYRP